MSNSQQTVDDSVPSKKITITDIQFITTGGETVVYIKDDSKGVYKQNFAENESLILLNVGDIITVYYEDSEETIKEMISYK